MVDKKRGQDLKEDFSLVAYILGIVSIVLAIFTPVAGIVLGIIGLVYSKKQKTPLSVRAKKFNIIGIVIGIIVLVLTIIVAITASSLGGVNTIGKFPIS